MNSAGSGDRSLQLPLFRKLLSDWPFLVVAGMLGGVVGLAASLLLKPVYQSEAVLGVNINYGITESLELVVEDRVLGRVAAVVEGDATLTGLLAELPEDLPQRRGWAQPADIRPHLRLDRRLGEWALVGIDEDSATAAQLAQAWASAAIGQLDEAMQHAWRAAALMSTPFDVKCEPVPAGGVTTWNCVVTEAELDPEALAGELESEAALSRGIPPVVSYELLRSAQLPTSPVIWGRGPLILAGAAIGLVLALIYVVVGANSSRRPN